MAGRLFKIGLGLVAGGFTAFSGGCHWEGGPLWSGQEFAYVSTTWSPKTVTVMDLRTGEAVWTVDVPVGQKVSFKFSEGTGPNEYNSDEIVWEFMEMDDTFVARTQRSPCPPAHARRVDLTLRPAPETIDISQIPKVYEEKPAGTTRVPGM